ncbi:MAG: cobalt ECF transporter T component CbiQ [Gemmata sp.]
MTLAFRHRPVPDSALARWDARWKLAAVLVAVGAVASLNRLAPAGAALALGVALLVFAKLPPGWVRSRLLLFAAGALPFVLVLPFALEGEGWDVGPVRLSGRGLAAGAAVLCRALAVGCFALLLVGTAPLHHTLAAAHKLKVPGLLVQIALLAYRYAFLLADEMRRVRVAMRTRGFRVRASRHGYRSLGHAAGALLVRGAERADGVAAAMRCRGFGGQFHSLSAFTTRFADALGFVALAAATIALVLWDRLGLS